MSVPTLLGQKRKFRTTIRSKETYDGAKRLASDSRNTFSFLGQSVMDKYLTSQGTVASSYNIFGQDIPVIIGEKQQDIRTQIKVYPKLFGKTKQKLYDMTIPLMPGHLNSQLWATAQQGSLVYKAKEISQFDSPPAYGITLTKDNMWDLFLKNSPRLRKSIQWYMISGRKILNTKILLTVYADKGKNMVVVDYDDIQFNKANETPFQDKMIAVQLGSITDYLGQPNLVADAAKVKELHPELQNNLIDNENTIQAYETELSQRVNIAKQRFQQAKAENLDNELFNIKIGYLPFAKKIMIFADTPTIGLTLSVKFYYQHDSFEPYLSYLYQTIIPKSVYGTNQMFINEGAFKDDQLKKQSQSQFRALKSSSRRLSKLSYFLSNQDYLRKVQADHIHTWIGILADWQAIHSSHTADGMRDEQGSLDTASYYKYKKYNRGVLQSYQGMYTVDVEMFSNQIAKLYKLRIHLANEFKANYVGFVRGLVCLINAYNAQRQKGASDEVTKSIIDALLNNVNSENRQGMKTPRAPRSNNYSNKPKYGGPGDDQDNNGDGMGGGGAVASQPRGAGGGQFQQLEEDKQQYADWGVGSGQGYDFQDDVNVEMSAYDTELQDAKKLAARANKASDSATFGKIQKQAQQLISVYDNESAKAILQKIVNSTYVAKGSRPIR